MCIRDSLLPVGGVPAAHPDLRRPDPHHGRSEAAHQDPDARPCVPLRLGRYPQPHVCLLYTSCAAAKIWRACPVRRAKRLPSISIRWTTATLWTCPATALSLIHIFDAALRALGVENREHVLVVGDGLSSDIQGGVNAGLDTPALAKSRCRSVILG